MKPTPTTNKKPTIDAAVWFIAIDGIANLIKKSIS